MKRILQYIIHPFYKRYHFWYHRKPRKYHYKKVFTIVQPNVFSPKHTVSTKVFLDFISGLDLNKKNVLELGCGSGIIALQSAFLGAKVTATDINAVAVNALKKVAVAQQLEIETKVSDLFENLDEQLFNYIFINPPYYPKTPVNMAENAWFCGSNFEYFERLFKQLTAYLVKSTQIYMILSDQCDLQRIQLLAKQCRISFILSYRVKLTFETNFIFKLSLT